MNVDKLYSIMNETWGDDRTVVDAMIRFLSDLELVANVMKKDLIFNRYSFVYSWEDLAYEIINDDELWENRYDETYCFLRNNKSNTKLLKEFLIAQNWAIDTTNGEAIGFDNEVRVINHEIKGAL